MASLVLGGIGGFMFGPIGFLAGSLIGNLLSPTKQEGPRLHNLKLQGSSYGQMIPIPYGTIRLAGQVVWQTDLHEHKHTSGGKGGPQVTTFTYTVSFAVKICKGPIAGVLAIWANGEIIYDVRAGSTVDNSKVPVTIYTGNESALPDPTMEADLGVGHVPAFRDDAAVVFNELDVGNYGNTLPQLSFLVFASGSPIPWRVSSFTSRAHQDSFGNRWSGTYDPITKIITVSNYGGINLLYNEQQFLVDGTTVGTPIVDVLLDPAPDGGVARQSGGSAVTGCNACYAFGNHDPGVRLGSWYIGTSKVGAVIGTSSPSFAGDCATAVDGKCVYANGFIYAVWQNGGAGTYGVARWPAPDGVPTGLTDAHITVTASNGSTAASNMSLGTSDTGDIFIAVNSPFGSDPPELWQYNADFSTLKHHWLSALHGGSAPYIPTAPPDGVRSTGNFIVYNGMICFNSSEPGPTQVATVWRIGADYSFSKDPSVQPLINGSLTQGGADLYRFSNGLVIGQDGVISLDPQNLPITLASIVANISNRVGLASSEYDVSQLTDLVDGYLITTRADARTDVDQLRSAYYFDAADHGNQAVFVKRGAGPVITIPDDDLAAQVRGDAPPAKVEVERINDIELPASVDVKFINSGAAYQEGDQQAVRQATLSKSPSDISLAIAMSDGKARQIANVLLYDPIAARNKCKIQVSRKYLYLEPTDVISATGKIIRLEKKNAKVNGVVAFEGSTTVPALYTIALTSAGTSGGQQPTTGTAQPTTLLLLGLPLISDGDDGTSFYAAMAGSVDSTWRNATLYQSADNGVTWTQVAFQSIATTMGVASTALGSFGEGNMFDEINSVTVVIGPGGGTLSGASRVSVMAGANKYLLGDEIIQPRNVTLIAPNTYLLSGMLRGRRGTEWHMGQHAVNERFVDLSSVTRVTDPISYRGQNLLYKAVSSGNSLASTSAVLFTDMGSTLRPYSPVLFNGGINSANDVLTHWTRRTRIGGEWVNYADVPLSEASEKYVLQVWNADHTICARVVTNLTSPTYTYLDADQITDFGVEQQTYYMSIGEIGSYGLGVQTFAAIPGGGGVINDPIVSRTPYNTSPPSPPLVTVCPGSVTTDTAAWAAGTTAYDSPSDLGPGKYWVLKFTLPSNPVQGGGSILCFEFASPMADRIAVLSRSPCGPPLIPSAKFTGAEELAFYFYVGANPNPQSRATLLPGETYYLSITNVDMVSLIRANFNCKG